MQIFTMLLMSLSLACIPICICDGQNSHDLRTWVSRNGQQQMEAEFVRYDPKSKTVELKTESGQTIAVDLQNFSQSDQRFVTRVARKGINRNKQRPNDTNSLPVLQDKKVNRNRIANLFGINWVKDLDSATKFARGGKSPNDDKPVFWFRVLGQLDGFM